jgi:hypothetical protein
MVSSFSFAQEPISSEDSPVKQSGEPNLNKLSAANLEDNRKLQIKAAFLQLFI